MIDVALSLDRPDRRLLAVSRRGLLPRTHAAVAPSDPPGGPLDRPLDALRTMRAHARAVGWRGAIDSIRPLTTAVWRSWSEVERRRFLRHLQPWWDAHRHRVSAIAAERLSHAMWSERFRVLAGRVERLAPIDGGFRADLRLRGRGAPVTRDFAAVVNCTGLSGDLRASQLLASLERQGLTRGDALGLGVDVDDASRLRKADGRTAAGLYAVGPLTRGAFWETVAVPDLRNRTAELAVRVVAELRRVGAS
jgi:uncharacterized NAD(P)/FAD-binding protein YdhS